MPLAAPADVPPVVVVQAARLPEPAGDPAFSIIRLDPQALAGADQLDQALDSAPGFSLYRRTSSLGANPTTQGVSLRGIAGSGASRALVTLDGVPQNDPFGGWVIWTSLPPEAIAAARLVRGAGAGPYGAGALTGTVDLIQPSRIDGQAAGDLVLGDHAYGRAAGITEIDSGPTRLFLDASDETSGGWVPVIHGRGAADRPLTLRDWSTAERAQIDLGAAVLTERIAGYDEQRGAGTLWAASRDQGLQASLTLVGQPQAGRLGWRLQTWVDSSNLANSSASVPASRASATLADNQYATPAIGGGLNAALRQSRPDSSWELGADVRDAAGESHERLYSQGLPTGTRDAGGGALVAGLYAEASRTWGGLLLTGGARLDDWRDFGSKLIQTGSAPLSQHPADRGGLTPTARLGLRRALSGGLYLRAAAYAGFRPATLNELHRPFRVGNDVTLANPDLTPERLYGVEAGIGGQGALLWDADLFFNQLADAVTNVTLGKGPGSFPLAGFVPAGGTLYQRENVGAVNAYGLEGEAEQALTPTLDLRGAFAWTHARVDGGVQAPQLTGRRPALTPTLTLTAAFIWRPVARLTLTGEGRFESDRFDDDLNTRLIKAGAELDTRASWRLTPALSAYVAADNLLNADLQTGRSAAGLVAYDAPRLVRLGLTWRR